MEGTGEMIPLFQTLCVCRRGEGREGVEENREGIHLFQTALKHLANT